MVDALNASAASSVAELLQQFMQERGFTLTLLAVQAGVSKATLHRWLNGKSKRPYHLGGLLKVAIALRLRRMDADRLLHAAGYGSIESLAASVGNDMLPLLAHWSKPVPHNLPAELTSFVGRSEDIVALAELLNRDDVRLITLTGPGGSGKTRLSIRLVQQVLDGFPDGVYVVSLASLTDHRLVLRSIAEAVGLRDGSPTPLLQRVSNWLRSRTVLLLLDNLEQLTDCGPEIIALLRSAAHVKVLATSRVPLHVTGEHEWEIEPFPVPSEQEPVQQLDGNPAIQLFTHRARAANPRQVFTRHELQAVREICARLDGLPLAIELAAARTRDRDPSALLVDFPSRLDLASDGPRDVPARQQTLRHTISWSFNLLAEPDRRMCAQVAAFVGGWTGQAAAQVCFELPAPLDQVTRQLSVLVDASLIERFSTANGGTRYRMLETIREFGSERLADSGQEAEVRERHARFFLALAEAMPKYVPETRSDDSFDRIETNLDNIRVALEWYRSQADLDHLARFVAALWPYLHEHLRSAEGQSWVNAVLPHRLELPVTVRAQILSGACVLASAQSLFDKALEFGSEALALFRQADDHRGQAIIYRQLGWGDYMRGSCESSLSHFANALEEWHQVGDPRGIALGLSDLGLTHCALGNLDLAAPYLQETEARCRMLQDDVLLPRTIRDRGLHALLSGEFEKAIPLLEEAITGLRAVNRNFLLHSALFYLGTAHCFAGNLVDSRRCYEESLEIPDAIDDKAHVSLTILGLAAVAIRQGDGLRSATLCGASHAIQQANQIVFPPAAENLYARESGMVQEVVGEAAFKEAFDTGSQMTMAEALSYARVQAVRA